MDNIKINQSSDKKQFLVNNDIEEVLVVVVEKIIIIKLQLTKSMIIEIL